MILNEGEVSGMNCPQCGKQTSNLSATSTIVYCWCDTCVVVETVTLYSPEPKQVERTRKRQWSFVA